MRQISKLRQNLHEVSWNELKKQVQKRSLSVTGNDLFSQGYKDSNLEMTESESVALPFGDSPLFCNAINSITIKSEKQGFFTLLDFS